MGLSKSVISTIKIAFFLFLGILFIWLSVKGLSVSDKREILASFRKTNYVWVLITVFLGLLSHLVRAHRWILLIQPMQYRPGLKNTFYAVMTGYFANMAVPRLGEVTRCGILYRLEKIPVNKSLGTVITERAFDMLVFVILFVLTVFSQYFWLNEYLKKEIFPKFTDKFSGLTSNTSWIFILGTLIVLLVVFYFLYKRVLRKIKIVQKVVGVLKGFWQGIKSLTQLKKPWLFLFDTVIIWFLYFLMVYICFFCMEATSGLSMGAALSTLVLGSVGIMVTPGGIGLYPLIVEATLKLYGVPNTAGLAFGWVSWTAQSLTILLGGTIVMILMALNKNPHDATGNHSTENSPA